MQANSKAILCICDDAVMLQVRQMMLERFGYRVLPTDSVEAAASIAKVNRPDMLLMDAAYCDIDVEKATEEIKKLCPELVTVVLTAYYSARRTSDSIVDSFVPRDDGPDRLISEIRQLLSEDSVVGREPQSAPWRDMAK